MYNNQPMHKLLSLIRLVHVTIFATFDNHDFVYYNLIISIEHPLWMGPYRLFSFLFPTQLTNFDLDYHDEFLTSTFP
jgi:hypothetical protein